MYNTSNAAPPRKVLQDRQVIPAQAVEAAYIVSIWGDLEGGNGYDPLPLILVYATHEDDAVASAFNAARVNWPEVGDMDLAWVKLAAGQIVAGGDLRFTGGHP